MRSCFLIGQQDAVVLPDCQELFLSSPDQAITLSWVPVSPSEFRERLAAAVKRKGRKNVLGHGVTEGALSKVLSGAVKNPRLFTVLAICERADVTLGSILQERGYELNDEDRAMIETFITWAAKKIEPPELSSGRNGVILRTNITPSQPATETGAAQMIGALLVKPHEKKDVPKPDDRPRRSRKGSSRRGDEKGK
jgi:DNA-binding Xre family transcriptional regulator